MLGATVLEQKSTFYTLMNEEIVDLDDEVESGRGILTFLSVLLKLVK